MDTNWLTDFKDNEQSRTCYACTKSLPLSKFGRETSSTTRILYKTACKTCLSKNNKGARNARKLLGTRPPLNYRCTCGKIYLGDAPDDLQARRSWVPDHDSKTDRVRGWLCRECNTCLGKARHDPNILVEWIVWLLRHGCELDVLAASDKFKKAQQENACCINDQSHNLQYPGS